MDKSKRWYLIQTVLLLLALFWPFAIELPLAAVVKNAGMFLVAGGAILWAVVVVTLKRNLVLSMKPKVGGELITTGLYSLVRHPGYGAVVIAALGWGLWLGDGARLALAACLFFFFDAKAGKEEKWLEDAYPEYGNYKKRVVKKFIPWIY